MKTGDLVNFISTFHPFQKDYFHRNPGVVLNVKGTPALEAVGRERTTVTVMWANGEITNEHSSYVKIV